MRRSGFAISSRLATLHEATLTRDRSSMSAPTTSAATRNATSSPASEDGATHSALPTTLTIDLFGQAHVPASPSPQPERARRPMTNATCGLRGFLSSASADLQSSLVSRLRRRLDGVGSTLFSLTWKRKATPAGRPYYQLAASARRTSDSGFGSWQSPNVVDATGRGYTYPFLALPGQAQLASWPTPNAGPQNDGDTTWRERRKILKEKHGNGNGFGMVLGQAAQLARWPTPKSGDADKGVRTEEGAAKERERRKNGYDLPSAAWSTPTTRDHKDGASTLENTPINALLGRQVQLSGSIAPTEKRGQLNPAFSLWLMGYPAAWANCAPQATRSSRKSRRNS
jgi:hypothetical protein